MIAGACTQGGFGSVASCVANLTPKVYAFLTYISTIDRTHASKGKISRESRIVPQLIFHIEQFESALIKLSKHHKVRAKKPPSNRRQTKDWPCTARQTKDWPCTARQTKDWPCTAQSVHRLNLHPGSTKCCLPLFGSTLYRRESHNTSNNIH